MAYTHTSYGQLKTQLSLRLADATKVFWTDTELGIYVTEALRTFGLCSGFWRERGTIVTSAELPFYDINQNLTNAGGTFLLKPTVTDQDIIQAVQFHLLESTTSQTVWTGTEMFSINDINNSIQNRLNQFLSDTGCVVNRSFIAVNSPPNGRQVLDQGVIDVRYASWLGAPPEEYYNTLWREDERLLTTASQVWDVDADTPDAYSVMAPPPLQIQLSPIPLSSGELELLTVNSTTLNPPTETVLGIPDNLTPAIKWGVLADLLGKDGIARDAVRADHCERQYGLYVELARMVPVVIHTELNGVPLIASTLQEVAACNPLWENNLSTPTDVILAAPNLLALNPVPDNVYSVTCDVVRNTPLPATDNDFVQVGREQVNMILDYAEHLALFKVAGPEWHATDRAAKNFLIQCLSYNQRISAAARASFSASEQSQRQKQEITRRGTSAIGVGALRGNPR